MKKTILTSLSALVVAMSMSVNASERSGGYGFPSAPAGQTVHQGLNVVYNVGSLVVSFSQVALNAVPALVEHGSDLVQCFSDRMRSLSGEALTAPVLCPIQIGTDLATAIILTGVHGVQAVVAVPSQFAHGIADLMLHASRHSWEAMDEYNRIPGFFLLPLGVAVVSGAIGVAAGAGAWAIDLVSTAVGATLELAVYGVRTGILFAAAAVVVVADAAVGRVKVIGKDIYGVGKSLVVTLVTSAHGHLTGDRGAIGYFLTNFVGRLVTLPFRLVLNESFEEMMVSTAYSSCDQAIYEATGACH